MRTIEMLGTGHNTPRQGHSGRPKTASQRMIIDNLIKMIDVNKTWDEVKKPSKIDVVVTSDVETVRYSDVDSAQCSICDTEPDTTQSHPAHATTNLYKIVVDAKGFPNCFKTLRPKA